jgi:hypothetical protein
MKLLRNLRSDRKEPADPNTLTERWPATWGLSQPYTNLPHHGWRVCFHCERSMTTQPPEGFWIPPQTRQTLPNERIPLSIPWASRFTTDSSVVWQEPRARQSFSIVSHYLHGWKRDAPGGSLWEVSSWPGFPDSERKRNSWAGSNSGCQPLLTRQYELQSEKNNLHKNFTMLSTAHLS